jgi:hypothetical protein
MIASIFGGYILDIPITVHHHRHNLNLAGTGKDAAKQQLINLM